jgi:hypothetical protein
MATFAMRSQLKLGTIDLCCQPTSPIFTDNVPAASGSGAGHKSGQIGKPSLAKRI